MEFKNTPLYGGAITMDLPANFADASNIRQIPDHQEVYLDANGYTSIVVEILEYVNKSSDDEALQYHFADLVDGTGDATSIIAQEKVAMKMMPPEFPILGLTFIQTPPSPTATSSPPRPNRKTPEYTYIQLLLLRLKDQGTDLMISINTPHYPGEYAAPAQPGAETPLMLDSKGIREKVLESFQVKEWGLFEG